jgi:agmatine/peptidylarginine deiminase
MRRIALLLLCSSLALGCQSPPTADGSNEPGVASSTPDSVTAEPLASRRDPARSLDYVFRDSDLMQHAYRDVSQRPKAKADGDEVRVAYPQHYAITEPPSGDIRAMVEWEPMEAVVMQVPDYIGNYDGVMGTIQGIGAQAISVAEVWYVVESSSMESQLKSMLASAGVSNAAIASKTRFLTTNLESIWFIDSGPLPIIDLASDTYAFADFRYYQDRAWDDGVSTLLGRSLTQMGEPNNTETYRMPVHTEGGTFQATSDGVCFTGARQLYNMSCLDTGCNSDLLYLPLSDLQSHPYTQELEASWGPYAGCTDVVVTYSITDDGTGHIDMYMKVASDDLVIMGEYVAPYDNDAAAYNATRLDANAAFLESYVKPGGGGFNVGRIVMPGHRNTNSGAVPFTYINSTMINGLNLWPATTYGSWEDSRAQAASQWQALMPGYEHIWIDATEISFWSGAVHCITRTIPDKAPGLWIGDGTCSSDDCVAPDDGYDHACYPTNNTTSPICWGPDWLCSCNNCDVCGPPAGGGGGVDDPCDGIGYEGCCDGTTLKYCDNGEIKGGGCGGQGCGWDGENGYYDCGGSGADPSGTFPISCDADTPCEPTCEGAACGSDGCGGSCGACPDGSACNGSGQCAPTCTPSCDGVACGSDGCGGSCGACAEGQSCESGQCEDAPSPCGDLTYEGCCDGTVLKWCQNNEPLSQTCDQSCGWNTEYGYLCGETGEDPSGAFPLACPGSCVPDCSDKACGDDGCGGSCGACTAGTVCETNQCVAGPCQPNCDGANCGPDGCGGSCGTCPTGEGCNAEGLCQAVCTPNCDSNACGTDGCGGSCGACGASETCEAGQCVGGCGDLTFEGCCDDSVLTWCSQQGELENLNCGSSCGWNASQGYYDCAQTGAEPTGTYPLSCDDLGCTPDCDGKSCGDDGCGGLCGACGDGEVCGESNQCAPGPCVPECAGLACGDDGCSGSCGTCAAGQFCTDAGQCEDAACVPDCEGAECGSDGCGGSCGACAAGEVCTDQGDCKVSSCESDCTDKTCGADGCGDSCGSCDPGTVCIAGQCTGGSCEPDCEGKACGSDGCGGWCGTCQENLLCTAEGNCVLGECTPACEGKVCGADGCGGLCGSCPAGQGCTQGGHCVNTCEPDCADKVCGSDGCGGLCGDCAAGEFCSAEGACAEGACVPDCDGKACGDDGCGQLCGLCGDGETCSPQSECVPAGCVPDCAEKDCGDDGCGGSCGGCPDGQVCGKEFRCETEPCEPSCDGKVCGDDSCGGSCGSCADGEECSKDGDCVTSVGCVPDCDGLSCGDDGCGTLCGLCAEDETCEAGTCQAAEETIPDGDDLEVPDDAADAGGSGTTSDAATEGPEGTIEGDGGPAVDAAEGCQAGGAAQGPWALAWLLGLGLWARRRRLV